MSKCPEGGCSKGETRNVILSTGNGIGVIWCPLWQDITWHPISKGRECPYGPKSRPEPHWWPGKDDGKPFDGWEE